MKIQYFLIPVVLLLGTGHSFSQTSPDEIQFIRQGVSRPVFDPSQSISLASMHPGEIIGFPSMYPIKHNYPVEAEVSVRNEKLFINARKETLTNIWFGGFNPFSTYFVDLKSVAGKGEIGFEFSDAGNKHRFIVYVAFNDENIEDIRLEVRAEDKQGFEGSVDTRSDSRVKHERQI